MNLNRSDQYLIIILVFILVFVIGAVVAELNDVGILMMVVSGVGIAVVGILLIINIDKIFGSEK